MADITYKAPFTKGVNFTEWLEFKTPEQIDRDWFTRADFENARSLGADVVRLPIHFEKLCPPETGYRVPDPIWSILDDVARWADELDMCLIFDFHNATDTASTTTADVEQVLTPVWEQLAARYKGRFPKLIFEIMNEPHGIDIPVWNGIIERVFYRVRAIDAERWVIVGGADWNSLTGMQALPVFDDKKVIYTFHFYDPHTFTHQGAPWADMIKVMDIPFPYDPAKMPSPPADADERIRNMYARYPQVGTVEAISKRFKEYAGFSAERKAPVFCGEFGCNNFAVENTQRVGWYRLVADLLDQYGIPRISWDYFGSFGLFFEEKGKRPRFPEDLNLELLDALKLKRP